MIYQKLDILRNFPSHQFYEPGIQPCLKQRTYLRLARCSLSIVYTRRAGSDTLADRKMEIKPALITPRVDMSSPAVTYLVPPRDNARDPNKRTRKIGELTDAVSVRAAAQPAMAPAVRESASNEGRARRYTFENILRALSDQRK